MFTRLQKERHALNVLHKQPPIPRLDTNSSNTLTNKSPKSQKQSQKKPRDEIDLSLLDPSQQALYKSLNPPKPTPEEEKSALQRARQPMSPSDVSARLSRITTGLPPTLDRLAAGLHDIELYRSTADALSSQVLRICAQRLEERDARIFQHQVSIEGEDMDTQSSRVSRPRQDLGLILGALSRVERR